VVVGAGAGAGVVVAGGVASWVVVAPVPAFVGAGAAGVAAPALPGWPPALAARTPKTAVAPAATAPMAAVTRETRRTPSSLRRVSASRSLLMRAVEQANLNLS
jgi:hypothetical protein